MAKVILKKIFNILLIVIIIASVFLYPDWYKRQVHKIQGVYYVAQGDGYLRKKQFQKAINMYRHGLELYPEHYGAWFNLGNINVVYEDYYSSIDAYSKAIKYNPNYVLARMNYGIVSAEKLGDFDSAIEQYNKIIEIQNKPVYIPFVFNNLRSYKTNIGLAYYNKGVAYRQKAFYTDEDPETRAQNLRKAIEAFKASTKILKKDYDAMYNLALAYHLDKDYNMAGVSYCKAIKLAPMNYEAHYNLAILLNHLKYYKEALKEMQKANSILTGGDENTSKSDYIFGVMGDVTKNILKDDDGVKYLEEEFKAENQTADSGLIYINGKVKATEDLDKVVTKNMAECPSLSIFRDDEIYTDDDVPDMGW